MNPNDSSGGMAERTKNKLIYSERSWIDPTNEAGKSQYPPAKPLFIYCITIQYCLDSIRVKKNRDSL